MSGPKQASYTTIIETNLKPRIVRGTDEVLIRDFVQVHSSLQQLLKLDQVIIVMVLCQFVCIPVIGQVIRVIHAFVVNGVLSAVVMSKTPHERKLVVGPGQKDVHPEKKTPACLFEATDTHMNIDVDDNPGFGFTTLADDSNSLSAFG